MLLSTAQNQAYYASAIKIMLSCNVMKLGILLIFHSSDSILLLCFYTLFLLLTLSIVLPYIKTM